MIAIPWTRGFLGWWNDAVTVADHMMCVLKCTELTCSARRKLSPTSASVNHESGPDSWQQVEPHLAQREQSKAWKVGHGDLSLSLFLSPPSLALSHSLLLKEQNFRKQKPFWEWKGMRNQKHTFSFILCDSSFVPFYLQRCVCCFP